MSLEHQNMRLDNGLHIFLSYFEYAIHLLPYLRFEFYFSLVLMRNEMPTSAIATVKFPSHVCEINCHTVSFQIDCHEQVKALIDYSVFVVGVRSKHARFIYMKLRNSFS
jgi:hypothetical protein